MGGIECGDKNDEKKVVLDAAINFVRDFKKKSLRKKSCNEWLQMDSCILNNHNTDIDTISPFQNIDIDVDLNLFLPLIQRILEQCHLLLMDSYSRFKTERNRQIEYDMHDRRVIKQHSVKQL